jgi:hypothetical protein
MRERTEVIVKGMVLLQHDDDVVDPFSNCRRSGRVGGEKQNSISHHSWYSVHFRNIGGSPRETEYVGFVHQSTAPFRRN